MRAVTKIKRPPKTTRTIKIQPLYRVNGNEVSVVPHLRLCGNWLADVGFKPQQRVKVTVSVSSLMITLDDE